MKALRHFPALLASCLFAIVAVPLVRGDEEPMAVTVDWIGAGAEGNDNAANPANWMGPDEETPYSVAGDGSEVFRFGEYTPGLTNVFVPTILDEGENPIPVAVHDFVFSNTAANAGETSYNFSFTGNDAETSGLFLIGNVSLASNGLVTVEDSLAFLLSEGTHTATVDSNAILHVDAPIFEYEGDGSSGIEKWGAGTLILSSAYSDFDGGVSVREGKLAIGNSSQNGEEGLPPGGPLGFGTLKLYNGTALGVLEGGSFTLYNTIDLDCGGGSITIDLGCTDSLTLTGDISGYAGLVQTGGTLTLTGHNTFEGGVTVQDGATLQLGASSEAEWVEYVEYMEGGPSGGFEIDSSPVGTGDLKLENGSTLALADDDSYVLHNDIDLDCFSGSVTIDAGYGDLSLYGYISGSAGIIKEGKGTLALYNGYSDFSGGVTVMGGTLLLGASSQESEMESFSGDGAYYDRGPVGTGTLKLEAGSTLGLAGDDSYLLHNDIDLGCFDGSVTIDTGSGDLTLLGYITGSAGINKTGSGTLTLENENEMQGDFYVSAGTVEVNDDYALGYGALEFGTSSESTVNFNTEYPEIGGLEGSSSTDTINLGMGTELGIYQDHTSTFAGVITGSTGSVYLAGCGNLTLSGQSTFAMGFIVEEGATLTLGSSTTLTSGAITSGPVGTGELVLDPGATLSASGTGITLLNDVILGGDPGATQDFFIASGQSLTIGNGTLGDITGNGRLNKTGLGTLTLLTANTYSGGTSIGGGVLSVGNVNALGSGTVTIAGGALKLTNGVTNISNPLDFSSGGGGTLTGNWTFTTLQTFGAGVTLAPGNSPGTMNFGAGYAPTGGVTTEFEFASAFGTPGTDWDVISVTGALDLTSISTGNRYNLELISLDGSNTQNMPISGLVATSWVIFKTTTGVTLPGGVLAGDIDTLFNIDSSRFYGGGIFDLMISGNDIVLNFTPVPEPSTYALMALGTALTGLAAWRKRRRA